MRHVTWLLAGALLIGAAGCGSKKNPPASAGTAKPVAPATRGPSSVVSAITLRSTSSGLQFLPRTLTIRGLRQITITNATKAKQTIAFQARPLPRSTLPPGGKATYTFQKAGTYLFYDATHPKVRGSINVQAKGK